VARSPKRQIVEGILSAASDYIPDAIETPLRRALSVPRTPPKKVKSLAVPRPTSKPLALPAPPKPLALPAPGPGLPPFAVKTKGGQWFVDKGIGGRKASDLDVKVTQLPNDGRWLVFNDRTPIIFNSEDEARAKAQSLVDEANPNRSPENAARRIADNSLRLARDASGPLSQLQDWFLRAAPRYIKNEMGTPDDPMRALAERGGLHIEMSPDEWSDTASSVISRQPIGSYLGLDRLYAPVGSDPRAGNDYAASLAVNMPWLKKAPVTDELYGVGDTYALQEKMGMAHLLDEMRNAMDPRSGLPSDLAVRPESLGRMGLAQAAERVGLINQFRAKEMERAALSNINSPAVQTFKEYTENNPMGLRWSELKAPDDIPEGYSVRQGEGAPREGWFGAYGPDGQPIVWAPTEDQARRSATKAPLQQALKYEGDTMGHCVGNYCDDVMEGKSRIFSLRDAKGEPHVTIETRPGRQDRAYSDAIAQLRGTEYWPAWLENQRTRQDNPGSTQDLIDYMNQFRRSQGLEPIDAEKTQDIVQIKGKQNAKPKDDYLPFVQDFVKGGQWGNIGDMENTGLVKLPDGRYITGQQAEEIISAIPETTEMVRAFASRDMVPMRRVYDPTGLDRLDPEEWQAISQHFEGFAIGGRVDADRCFSYNPLTVKRGR
jgi:hypothetical protein